MASFTDSVQALADFNPHIQTLPVDDMIRVGLIKQEQFNAGISKVQGWVDTLSSLPIAKDEVKNYVQTRLGQLKEGVTKNLAGDFSDMRITNQIGGAAKTIARDPIVNNAVQSTARMQGSLSELAEAKKAGKSSPQNEAFLQNSISEWINDGQLETSFNGSYSPYIDVTERFLKLYKEQNPGQDIPNDAFRQDENGNTVINPVLFKGKSPAKIQALFNIVSSQPDVQNQLRIDGWYKYRGVTPNQLGSSLASNANDTLKNIEDSIRTLQAKIATGSKDNTLSAQIEQLKQLAVNRKKGYDDIVKLLTTNPEAAKTQLSREELNSNLINAYTYQTMEKSPLWETSLQERTFQRELYEWTQTYNQNERKFQWDMYKDSETLRLAGLKKKADGSEPGSGDVITEGPIKTSEVLTGSGKAYSDVQNAFDEYTQAQMELISRVAGGGIKYSPVIRDNVTGKYKFNFGPDKHYKSLGEAQGAVGGLLSTVKDQYINGQIEDSGVESLMDKTIQKQDNWKAKQQIVTDVEADYDKQLKAAGINAENNDYAKRAIVEQKLPGWEGLQTELIHKYGSDYDKGMDIGETIQGAESGGFVKGKNYKQYSEAKKLVTQNTAAILKKREDDYTKRQSTSIPYIVTHDVSKSENREAINTKFNALARSRKVTDSGKGDVADILEGTGKDEKDRGVLQYSSGVDPQTGQAYIEISDGTTSKMMEISRGEYERQFPERVYNNQFREKFGPRLDLTQQTSTDNGEGRASAYPARQPKESPYSVQYHVIKQGDAYNIKWWVSEKASPDTPLINGENASGTVPGMPSTLTEEEVIQWTEKFRDKNWLQQVIALKFLPSK